MLDLFEPDLSFRHYQTNCDFVIFALFLQCNKSRILETPTLLTNANSSTNTKNYNYNFFIFCSTNTLKKNYIFFLFFLWGGVGVGARGGGEGGLTNERPGSDHVI